MTRDRSETTQLIILGSHHPGAEDPTFTDIDRRDRRKGALGCGSHFVITRDGTTHFGRPFNAIGCASPELNSHSLFVCLAGGQAEDGSWEDNYTEAQRSALSYLVSGPLLVRAYPGIPVMTLSSLIIPAKNPGFRLSDWEGVPQRVPYEHTS